MTPCFCPRCQAIIPRDPRPPFLHLERHLRGECPGRRQPITSPYGFGLNDLLDALQVDLMESHGLSAVDAGEYLAETLGC